MSSRVLLLTLRPFVDSEGGEHWLAIPGDVAALLAATEPPLKERLLKDPAGIANVPDRLAGNEWEGPRLAFRWLVGESRTWHGEPVRETEHGRECSLCFEAKLPDYAYCLGCDQCGRELAIGKGSRKRDKAAKKAQPPRLRVEGPKSDGLKGGLEGIR